MPMKWTVRFHPDFEKEYAALDADVSDKLAEVIVAIGQAGPQLGRPLVDTLNASKHKNMKEIRFGLNGVWRFAFAFDPDRAAIILVGADKQGASQTAFYKNLIKIADRRFDEWLEAEE